MSDAIFSVGLFSFFINILMLTGPLYMLQVYDRVLSSQSMSTLVSLSLLMAGLYVFVWLLESIRAKVLGRLANSLQNGLSERTFEASMRMGLGQKKANVGSPLKDLGVLRSFFASNAMATIFDVPWVPVYLGVIFLLHWTLGVFAVVGALIIVVCAIYVQLVSKNPERNERSLKLKCQAIEEQTFKNAGMVKAMGMEGNLYARWEKVNQEAVHHSTQGNDRSGGVRSFSKAFRLFLQSGILGIGAALAINQVVSPGTMIAGSIILGRALTPAQTLIAQWSLIVEARASYKRLDAIYAALDSRPVHMDLPPPQGWLEVKGLVGAPPGSGKPTLIGLNFVLAPGDALSVVGPSASGKSSLAKFLVGIWMPLKGEVRLNGATFGQWHSGGSQCIGKYVGYLPQNVELFDGTIKDNIARFDPDAVEQDIINAAWRAGVHELILGLPHGYGTVLGEGGIVLSGGQMQRIALARALYGDPCLVVLDEPNANLDDQGEEALRRAIEDLRARGKTVVVITHRMGAISGVNKLLVMKDGRQSSFGESNHVLSLLRGEKPEVQHLTNTPNAYFHSQNPASALPQTNQQTAQKDQRSSAAVRGFPAPENPYAPVEKSSELQVTPDVKTANQNDVVKVETVDPHNLVPQRTGWVK